MEVHHHHHKHKTTWRGYVWEFFMLFLAVFCGYLAERKLEHDIEKVRERKLMQSLVIDLEADLFQIDSLKKRRKERNDSCDLLIQWLSNPALAKSKNVSVYYNGRQASRRIHFRPQDGTLQQLRHSGGFRVVHETEVLKDIGSYEVQLKLNQENIEVEEKELTEYSQIAARVFNANVFQEMTKTGKILPPVGNPSLLSYDPLLLNELSVKLHYWKRTSLTAVESLDILALTARRLINSVYEHYPVKRKSGK